MQIYAINLLFHDLGVEFCHQTVLIYDVANDSVFNIKKTKNPTLKIAAFIMWKSYE